MIKYTNSIVLEDLDFICGTELDWQDLEGCTCLVTGANGMLATYMIYALMHRNLKHGNHIRVVGLSRNMDEMKAKFSEFASHPDFILLQQDVCDRIRYDGPVDYLFHFAGNASPYWITHDPVGIMKSNLLGTMNILELAREKQSKKVIFASTREVYGENNVCESLAEDSFGALDILSDRSCYPESKRAAETLCKSYYLQYGVNFNTVRIAHSYGPGMKLSNDGRVMADLLSCAVDGRNIILKSTGEAKRAFCYVADAITGLLTVTFRGKNAEAYNLSNETEEISICDLAALIVSLFPERRIGLEFHIPEKQSAAYCAFKRVRLDTSKLEKLGWKPIYGLSKGVKDTILSYGKL